MDDDDIDLISQKTLFRGFFQLHEFRLRHRLFNGGWTPELTREVFQRGHAVGLLPYDPDLDRLVFIEQFRTGAMAAIPHMPRVEGPNGLHGMSPWLWETVAGMVEKNEAPEQTARREAMEEAGCDVRDMELMTQFLVSPGGTSESVALYCGQVDASQVGGIHGLADESEDIRAFTVTPDEAYAHLQDGSGLNSLIVIAVQWFHLNHQRLRAKWRRQTP